MGLLKMGSVSSDSDSEEAWLRGQAIHPGRQRNVTDEDLDKLRGCIDLGFSFNEVASADVAPARRLTETLPALDLYYAVLCGVAGLRLHRGLRCLARIQQHRTCAFLVLLSRMSSHHIDLDQEEDSVEGAPLTMKDLDVNAETCTNLQGQASGRGKRKRTLKSKWWQYFKMLPKKEGEDLRCKCKACGITYKADSSMGTGNLRCHIINQCPRQKTRDIAQALLEQGDKSLAIRSQKFSQERFRELLILAIVRHVYRFSLWNMRQLDQFLLIWNLKSFISLETPQGLILSRCIKMKAID